MDYVLTYDCGEEGTCQDSGTLHFVDTCFKGIGIPILTSQVDGQALPTTKPSASLVDSPHADRILRAIFPVEEGAAVYQYDESTELDLTKLDPPLLTRIIAGTDGERILEELRRRQPFVDADYYFAWLFKHAFPFNGQSPHGSGIGFGDEHPNAAMSAWILPHEMTHGVMDMNHARQRGDEIGFDVQMRSKVWNRGVNPPDYWEIRAALTPPDIGPTGNNPPEDDRPGGGGLWWETWIRKAEYETAISELSCSDQGPFVQGLPRQIEGTVPADPTLPWDFQPSFQVENGQEDFTPKGTGPGEIRLLDDQGSELYSTHFDPTLSTELDSGQTLTTTWPSGFLVSVPEYAALDSIEVLENGVLQDAITRTVNAPLVSMTSPTNGEVLTSTISVVWQGSDSDGDPLHYVVLFSPDDGGRWIPLKTRTVSETVTVDGSNLPGTDEGVIRVAASDGINTTVADVVDLQILHDKLPRAGVLTPMDGLKFSKESNVVFSGTGFDPEDGVLPDSSFAWSSSLDGAMATGQVLNWSDLSVGTHTITLTVTDSASQQDSASVVVHIAPR